MESPATECSMRRRRTGSDVCTNVGILAKEYMGHAKTSGPEEAVLPESFIRVLGVIWVLNCKCPKTLEPLRWVAIVILPDHMWAVGIN